MAAKKKASYSIIGYAFGGSANIAGCREGPRVLRERGLVERLQGLGLKVNDRGDVFPALDSQLEREILKKADKQEKSAKNLAAAVYCCRQLADITGQALQAGSIPIVLGGDHSCSIGAVAAVSNHYAQKSERIGLIWIDTHPDINVPESSPSGNIFGMSVAFLLGLVPGVLSEIQLQKPAIKPENLVYIGLRDVDPPEKKQIARLGIKAFTMKEVDIYGIAAVVEQAVAIAGKDTAGFAVSFDLDVCEPQIVPGTGTPVRGGLNFREAHLLMELLYDAKQVLAWEVMELNPILDTNYETADLAIALLESACGKSIL